VTPARWWKTSSICLWVAAALLVASVVACVVVRASVDARQASLLRGDEEQAAALTSSSISNATELVNLLATSTTGSGASPEAFSAAARTVVHDPLSVALAKNFLGHYLVFAAAGRAFHPGTVLSPTIVAAVTATTQSPPADLHVTRAPGGSLSWSLGPPVVPPGNVVSGDLDMQKILDGFRARSPSADLQLSLYAGAHEEPSTLIATTDPTNRSARPAASTDLTVHGAVWTLQVTADGPVIGALANSAPLLVLLLGLALAAVSLLAGMVTEGRRRADRADLTTSPSTPPPVLATTSAGGPGDGAEPLPSGSSAPETPILDIPTSVVRDGSAEGYAPIPGPHPDVAVICSSDGANNAHAAPTNGHEEEAVAAFLGRARQRQR
jgi:hypothetical protein